MTQATHPTPKFASLRVSLFFFSQFMSVGMANSFAGIWFAQKGITSAQIGIINATPIAVMLLFTLFVGRIADKASDWRVVIMVGAVASAILPFGLIWAQDYWGILLFWSLAVVAQWIIVPVADAAAIRMARRIGRDFGTFRAFGTIGYLLVIFAAGLYVDKWGVEAFLPIFIGLCIFRGVVSLGLPRFRAPDEKPSRAISLLKMGLRPRFILPLLGWSLVFSTHLILNGFQGLLWAEQGLSPKIIGGLIGLGAAAETVMFFAFRHFSHRFSMQSLILVAALISALRWIAFTFSPAVPLLIGLQLLHAITYGLGFLACTNFIADETDETNAAEAQSLLVVMEQGIAVVAILCFGWLAGRYGAGAYWASATLSLLGAFLVWRGWRARA